MATISYHGNTHGTTSSTSSVPLRPWSIGQILSPHTLKDGQIEIETRPRDCTKTFTKRSTNSLNANTRFNYIYDIKIPITSHLKFTIPSR